MKQSINVVHISNSYGGGAGRAAYRIHEALLKKGINSSFINLKDPLCNNLREVFIETTRPSKVSFLKRQKNRFKFRIRKHFRIHLNDTRDSVKKNFIDISPKLNCEFVSLPYSAYNILENPFLKGADIVHLHWVTDLLDYPSFFQKNSKPVAWTIHDMNPFQGLFHYRGDEIRNRQVAEKFDNKVRAIKEKIIGQAKSKILMIAPSNWLLQEASRSKVFKNIPGRCIPYAVDTGVFAPHKTNDFKIVPPIPPGNLVLLFVAALVNNHRKGFDLLIEAIQKIKHFPVTLIVLGECNEFNIEGLDIRYVGNIQDNDILGYYYSFADAFVIPSREDNLPNVMLESLACGTPVIGFPVGGIKEHIINFKTGVLAKEINSDALAEAIQIFYNNRKRFNRDYIVKYANDHFDEMLIAEKYLLVYKELLHQGLNSPIY